MHNDLEGKDRENHELKEILKEIQHLPGENQKLAHKLKDCEDLLDDLGNDRDRAEKAKKKAHKDNQDKDNIIKDLEHKLKDKCKENKEIINILRENEPKVH